MIIVFASSLIYHLTLLRTSPLFGVTTPSTSSLSSTTSPTQLFMVDSSVPNPPTDTPTPKEVTSPLDGNSKLSELLPQLPVKSRRIYLIRHGETDWNAQGRIQGGGHDIPLNANGKLQAQAVAMALEDIPLTVIASSTLSRAKETADILWEQHSCSSCSCKRELDSGFREMGFGEFEGLATRSPELEEDVRNRLKLIGREVNENPELTFPGGGESTHMVEARACAALYKVLDQYPNERHMAIVSHGRTNKVVIASIGLKDVTKFRRVMQKNTAINVLDVDEKGEWTIRILDYIDHVKDTVIIR